MHSSRGSNTVQSMSNILSIPLTRMTVQTGTNEDWVESIKYVVGAASSNVDLLPQLDLRGIEFEMEVRHKATDHEVVLTANGANRRLGIGPFPNYGFLLLQVSVDDMKQQIAGDYVADVVASDGTYTRKVIEMGLTFVEGITR